MFKRFFCIIVSILIFVFVFCSCSSSNDSKSDASSDKLIQNENKQKSVLKAYKISENQSNNNQNYNTVKVYFTFDKPNIVLDTSSVCFVSSDYTHKYSSSFNGFINFKIDTGRRCVSHKFKHLYDKGADKLASDDIPEAVISFDVDKRANLDFSKLKLCISGIEMKYNKTGKINKRLVFTATASIANNFDKSIVNSYIIHNDSIMSLQDTLFIKKACNCDIKMSNNFVGKSIPLECVETYSSDSFLTTCFQQHLDKFVYTKSGKAVDTPEGCQKRVYFNGSCLFFGYSGNIDSKTVKNLVSKISPVFSFNDEDCILICN